MEYSVIIPTMWVNPGILHRMLDKYEKNPFIKEVILINNNKDMAVPIKAKKVRIEGDGKNKYVNPSWNLGVSLALHDRVIIANDDIFIDRFDAVIGLLNKSLTHGMIVGVDMGCFYRGSKSAAIYMDGRKIELSKSRERCYGWGVFMTLHKDDYVVIPKEYLIWCGDDILHDNLSPWSFGGVHVETKMSETLWTNRQFTTIGIKDKRLYDMQKRRKRKQPPLKSET